MKTRVNLKYFVRCCSRRFCKTNVELSNMERQTILSHCSAKMLKGNDMKMNSFFHAKRAKANPNKAVETDTTCGFLKSSESLFYTQYTLFLKDASQPCSIKRMVLEILQNL